MCRIAVLTANNHAMQDGGSAEEFAASTLPVQVALDVVTYLRAAARALPAAQKALPDDITARMLALHIHLLHHLLPQPVVHLLRLCTFICTCNKVTVFI
jgi:hypothetical protein